MKNKNMKILKSLNELFNLKDTGLKNEITYKGKSAKQKFDKRIILDNHCIIGIRFIDKDWYDWFVSNYFIIEISENTKLNYKIDTDKEVRSNYDINYLNKFLDVAKSFNAESVVLRIGNDYPLSMIIKDEDDNEVLELILAPRIDGDNKK